MWCSSLLASRPRSAALAINAPNPPGSRVAASFPLVSSSGTPKWGSTRFYTTAATSTPASSSRSRKYSASPVAPARGEATSTNPVAGERSSASTR